jgi:hypothetical protein
MRRQFRYYVVLGVIGAVILAFMANTFLRETPTCSDGKKNGTELGVDCGGACALVCKNMAYAPRVLWARAFQTDTGVYQAAAYVENPNPGAGAHNVRYSFQLYDDKSILIAERDGTMNIPPTTLVPVVELNITTGSRVVARTSFSFAEAPVWYRFPGFNPDLRLTGQELVADGSRLSASLANNSLNDEKNVSVVAVLFDANGVASGASKTTLDVPRKSTKPIVFTWLKGIPNVVRGEMTVVPSF